MDKAWWWSPAEVRQAQDALKKLKYAPGPSDGVFGPATLSAIELFQEGQRHECYGPAHPQHVSKCHPGLEFCGQEAGEHGAYAQLGPDYINPESLNNFEKQTNIRVVHEVFTNSTGNQRPAAPGVK